VAVIKTLGKLRQRSHEVAEEFQNYVVVQRAVGTFHEPPVPGTVDIVPLTDAGQLLEEGRAQRNCVGGYASRVAVGLIPLPDAFALAVAHPHQLRRLHLC
jgi:hypothetical protein